MSLRPRKPLVIFFILGALALGAMMIYSFGGRDIFTRHEQFLLYFDDSINGLAPGALVKFKGVPIGTVNAIRFNFRATAADRRIPVLIKLNADLLQRQLGELEDLSDPVVLADEVRRGLRAELDMQRYATGEMFVSLDYYPQAATPAPEPGAAGFAVIPTVSSSTLAHMGWVEKQIVWLPTVDIEAIVGQAGDYLDKLSTTVSAIPYAEYHQKIMDATEPLADFDFPAWQRNLNGMLAHFDEDQQAIAAASDQYSDASRDFVDMNTSAREVLAETDTKLAAIRSQINPAAPWLKNLTTNLKTFSSDLGNLTRKTDNLETQPDILPKLAQ
jgi:paraquat-inducible protein B